MTSEILTELRSLSCKVDTIQSEISQLNKKLTIHLLTCQRRVSQGGDPLQFDECENPDGSSVSNELDGPVRCQEQTLAKQNIDRIGTPKQKTDGSYYSGGEHFSQPLKMHTRKTEVHDRTPQYTHRCFKECRADCLRKALQQNIVLLVDNLPYSENDILDMLIENECLTETECSDIRNTGSRKDCVRNLVRIIKGRTYKVIKTFVDCIEKLHPEVTACIWQVYEKLVKDKKNYNKLCTFCVLKRSTDIKYVADHTWSIGAIPDELYDEIVDGRTDREALWTKLADACNKSNFRDVVLRKLTDALLIKGQYRDLVWRLRKLSGLKCACVMVNVDPINPFAPDITRAPDIVVVDAEENSTVSPLSTPASSRSFADENEIASDIDNLFVNKHENYILSPWIAENDKKLYTSCFGIRKCSTHAHSAVADEHRKSRSNSFGKSAGQTGNFQAFAKRRASMFM